MLGSYEFDLFKLIIHQIPKDPYAPAHAGIYRVQISRKDNRIVPLKIENKVHKTACSDFLTRRFFDASQQISKGIRGTGFSGIKSLMKEIKLPNTGKIKGMGIPKGITLITGGGYHGKSTLLKALEVGIYNHIPGDGRELCVSNLQTVKIQAYNGRSVVKTDISPFIKNLPLQKDTTSFCTVNASGNTSQAANIIEAIEVGAEVLLMNEDTCATNFMIRDIKMQKLVNKEDEPITTFIDKVKQLYSEKSISTVLVWGGVGDYFDISDLVIQMNSYQLLDSTAKAHKIAESFPAKRKTEDETYPFYIRKRIPIPASIDPFNDYGKLTSMALMFSAIRLQVISPGSETLNWLLP